MKIKCSCGATYDPNKHTSEDGMGMDILELGVGDSNNAGSICPVCQTCHKVDVKVSLDDPQDSEYLIDKVYDFKDDLGYDRAGVCRWMQWNKKTPAEWMFEVNDMGDKFYCKASECSDIRKAE